jgi:hypothetical protein
MLGLIDTLQDESIGILAGYGIVTGGIGVLSKRIQDGDAHGNKLGVELVHIGTAVQMKGKMVESRRIAIICPPFAGAPGTFERDGEHAVLRIGDGPTRHCRRAGLHEDSAVAQQRQDGIIKGNAQFLAVCSA